MGMSEETKKTLRERQAEKKARNTLQGLGRDLGMIAFDKVMDMEGDGMIPTIQIDGDGEVKIKHHAGSTSLWTNSRGGIIDFVRISYFRTRSERIRRYHSTGIQWIRLRRCPAWVIGEFQNRFQTRSILVKFYKGPTLGTTWESVTLVPIGHAFAWMQFLWPDSNDLAERVKKYWTGYTNGWVQKYPGAGAKIRVTKYHRTSTHTFPADAVVVEGRFVGPLAKIGDDETIALDHDRDEWEVTG